jgi:hypothetical protein
VKKMLDSETKDRLAQAIVANLPSSLTEQQADYWIKNPEYLPDALKSLASVVPLEPVLKS